MRIDLLDNVRAAYPGASCCCCCYRSVINYTIISYHTRRRLRLFLYFFGELSLDSLDELS
jgi:hypothetical protein